MDHLLDILRHPHYLGIFTLLVLGGFGLPFPEDATLILAGGLTASGVLHPIPAALVVYAGMLIADNTLYTIGRRLGGKAAARWPFRRLLAGERLARMEENFRRRGALYLLMGRHVVGVRAQLMVAAGALGMPRAKFVLTDAVAALFTIALMGGIGYAGGTSLAAIRRDMGRVEHWAVAAAVCGFLVFIVYRYFRRRARASDAAGED